MTETEQPVRIFLLDDHEVVRRAIAELLGTVPGFEIVGEAGTAADALNRILAVRPDVAVLDARLPDGSGIDVCRDIRSALPDTYCLILTSYDDHDAVLASVLAGASGYVLKEVGTSGLVDAIRQAALGRSLIDPGVIAQVMDRLRDGSPTDQKLAALTQREREVLTLITDGLSNRQIGEHLSLAEKTVKNYVSTLLGKLGMERRTQAAVFGADARRE
ncbi:MAG: response regulator transcription factor [Jatrophihabitans sp.]|jgi:two-component system response regulator DevR|nr:response regulator transcription factor [Jatrophihabitans sp.]MDT4906541.1 two-component system, NarL family, response regulator DevR [Pseudonocardiales bacterium]MDT4928719.1 two-component system, NarL family, response regulator DevR [Pseudonocardiales bacterium]MDT4948435.1 two-component system, NarL family, response regulator DevR [Pseudonocardiales bacterium]